MSVLNKIVKIMLDVLYIQSAQFLQAYEKDTATMRYKNIHHNSIYAFHSNVLDRQDNHVQV